MKKIVTLYFILLSFFLTAQENNLDVKALQDEMSKYEKVADTLNENYFISVNKLAVFYQKEQNYSKAENLLLKNIKDLEYISATKSKNYLDSIIQLLLLFYEKNKYLEFKLIIKKY